METRETALRKSIAYWENEIAIGRKNPYVPDDEYREYQTERLSERRKELQDYLRLSPTEKVKVDTRFRQIQQEDAEQEREAKQEELEQEQEREQEPEEGATICDILRELDADESRAVSDYRSSAVMARKDNDYQTARVLEIIQSDEEKHRKVLLKRMKEIGC